MFAKYIEVIGDAEGVHYLHREDWTPDEWEAITALYAEVLIPTGRWLPFQDWELITRSPD